MNAETSSVTGVRGRLWILWGWGDRSVFGSFDAFDRSMHHQHHQDHRSPMLLRAQGHPLISPLPETPTAPLTFFQTFALLNFLIVSNNCLADFLSP
jgi:hypothetical protein